MKVNESHGIESTTGTNIETYFKWIAKELEKKNYGEVSITFVVTKGQVTYVKKTSMDNEQYALQPSGH